MAMASRVGQSSDAAVALVPEERLIECRALQRLGDLAGELVGREIEAAEMEDEAVQLLRYFAGELVVGQIKQGEHRQQTDLRRDPTGDQIAAEVQVIQPSQ